MDEKKENNIMETNPPSPPPPLTWRDGAIPLLALALSAIFWADFGPERMDWPHWGVPALVAAHFGAVLAVLGRQVRINAGGVICTAAALVLGLCCALYKSGEFLIINCFAILLVAAMGTFALSGHMDCGAGSAVPDAIRLSFLAAFTRLSRPFRAVARAFRTGRKRTAQAVLAVLIALPVLAVVLWLLTSADAVFAGLFDGLRLTAPPEDAVMRVVRVLVLAPFLASALTYIRETPAHVPPAKPDRDRRAALFLPVTALLDLVYIIFCTIQVRYLFGGASDAAMAGGWAEYARSGFFQLVTITIINLCVILLGADSSRFASRGGKLLRVLYGLLLALTAVILVSAFWRMRLYILAFGMSVLRLLTLWAMAVIAAGILAAARKLTRPGFGFFRTAGTFALALWCAMNLAGPVRMIADYNVDRYLSGDLAEMDTAYLRSLGPDAQAALDRLDSAE